MTEHLHKTIFAEGKMCCSQQIFHIRHFEERKAQVKLTTLVMDEFHQVTQQVCTIPGPWNGSHKFSAAIICVISYTCAHPAITWQNVCSEKWLLSYFAPWGVNHILILSLLKSELVPLILLEEKYGATAKLRQSKMSEEANAHLFLCKKNYEIIH